MVVVFKEQEYKRGDISKAVVRSLALCYIPNSFNNQRTEVQISSFQRKAM